MAPPALRRSVVDYVCDHYPIYELSASRLVLLTRTTKRYIGCRDPRLDLLERMRELARARVRFGHRLLHVLLRRKGRKLGETQMYRLYTQESLQLRSKLPNCRKMAVTRRERFAPNRPNEAWCMDFVADQLVNRERFRALTLVDVFSRETLAIEVGQKLRREDVVEVCNRLVAQRRAPKRVLVDNGSEFSGRMLDLGAYHHGVQIDFRRPGKPTDNFFIETFNG